MEFARNACDVSWKRIPSVPSWDRLYSDPPASAWLATRVELTIRTLPPPPPNPPFPAREGSPLMAPPPPPPNPPPSDEVPPPVPPLGPPPSNPEADCPSPPPPPAPSLRVEPAPPIARLLVRVLPRIVSRPMLKTAPPSPAAPPPPTDPFPPAALPLRSSRFSSVRSPPEPTV